MQFSPAFSNGKVSDTPFEVNDDWRMSAMHAALLCQAEDGTCFYVLLAALQQHAPEYTARYFSESKKRVFDALGRFFPVLHPIVSSAWDTDKGVADDRIFGWWRGTTIHGAEYDIILAPDCYSHGTWIVAGADATELNRLCDGIVADATRNTCRSLRFSDGSWDDAPEIDREISAVSYDDIVLSPTLLADIRANVDTFFNQKEVFHRLGFSWRRGILLVGPPGTGKTMLCKAAANAHPEVRFLYVRDLGNSGSRRDALRPIFQKARRLAPCILAIEDMDGLIHKENRTTFLNELDGFKNNDGLLIIASSNHPERIDEALLKRPSRFDRVYHIGLPEPAERTEYCRRLLQKSPLPVTEGLNIPDLAAEIAGATPGFTPAFLKEAILSALLAAAQNGNDVLDTAFGRAVLEQVGLLKNYLKKVRTPESLAEISNTGDNIGFRPR